MMQPSFEDMIRKLSKLQRDFLVDHVDGLRPFVDQPIENQTRESLVARKLVRYEPLARSQLGAPNGTMLTDAGREALCWLLGQYADALMRGIAARCLDQRSEAELLRVLTESATHWSVYDRIARNTDAAAAT